MWSVPIPYLDRRHPKTELRARAPSVRIKCPCDTDDRLWSREMLLMTKRRQALGRDGEAEAARFLEARGYRIVARNVRAARVEIDLIAQRASLIAIVEVKSRRATSPDGFGGHAQAAEAVDPQKQARLRRGARAWLDTNRSLSRRASRVRFDVVTCLLESAPTPQSRESAPRNDTTSPEGARWSVQHWEAAF